MPTIPYFAYGSNLLTRRLRAGVPSARPLGPALLKGHSLAWQKIGADGSGKCDILPDPDEAVWGVLYELDPVEKPQPDADDLHRADITRETGARVISEQTTEINYGNFTASIEDRVLHDAYLGVWSDLHDLDDRYASH